MTDNFYLFKRLLQVGSVKHVYDPGERTPYPIIMEKPTVREVLMNMGAGEYTPLMVFVPLGAALAFNMTRGLQPYPLTRRRAFAAVWGTCTVFAFWLGYKGSYYKLTGFENNGLQWRTPNRYNKRYNFTDEMYGSAFAEAIKRDDIDSSKII